MLKERRAEDAVVPVELDGTRVEGWESADFAIRRRNRTGKEIADLIIAAYRVRHPEDSSASGTGEGSRQPAVLGPLVFISYSHRDTRWKDRLLKHLEP